ncbi:glycoside hydrolase/deacetylase [Meredithblackwellia eburnea MCA 4105]
MTVALMNGAQEQAIASKGFQKANGKLQRDPSVVTASAAWDKLQTVNNPAGFLSEPSIEGYRQFLPPRDFVGYGVDSPADCWPNSAKICLSFVLNYEEGAEHSPWNGDGVDTFSEPYLNETSFHRQELHGRRDSLIESMYEYGTRSGFPRILKLFQKHGFTFTTWANARALEVTPRYAKMLVDSGCEVACHGNRWIFVEELGGPAEEAAAVNHAIDRLQASTGLTDVPSGWYYGRGTLYNKYIIAKVHRDRGIPLLYTSDSYADDIPYYTEHPFTLDGEDDSGLLNIPYTVTTNDLRFLCDGAGFSAGTDFFNHLKSEFDQFYKEGLAGRPKMMSIALHSRIIGHPGRFKALQSFVEYVSKIPDVWVANRKDIAQHWRSKFPYEKPTRLTHADELVV